MCLFAAGEQQALSLPRGIWPATEQQALLAATEQQALLAATEQQALLAATEQQALLAATEQQALLAATEQQAMWLLLTSGLSAGQQQALLCLQIHRLQDLLCSGNRRPV